MARIYFEDFRLTVIQHVKEIETSEPESHSIEWFLLRYLRRIIKATEEEPVSPGKVEGTVRSLIRFYVDNIEENTEMGDRCTRVYEQYRKTLRENQEKE